jgi:hypothetical protein
MKVSLDFNFTCSALNLIAAAFEFKQISGEASVGTVMELNNTFARLLSASWSVAYWQLV